MSNRDYWSEDDEVVASLEARLCVECQALVTPPHMLCGWHDFWYDMRRSIDPEASFVRTMLGRR